MNTQHFKQRPSTSLAAHQLGASTSIDERPEAEAAAQQLGPDYPRRARASLQPVYEPRHYLASCAPIQFVPWARSLEPDSLSRALASSRRRSWAPQELVEGAQCAQCVQRIASAPDGADPLGLAASSQVRSAVPASQPAGLQHPGILRRYSSASPAGWLEQQALARRQPAHGPAPGCVQAGWPANVRACRRPSSQLVISAGKLKEKTQTSQELKVAQARPREHQVYHKQQQALSPHTCRRHTLAR